MDFETAEVTRGYIALAALAYAALTAHLLFIPYALSPLPFDATLHRFAHIPWMQLGSDQNVALVSRALMFLPLGVLLAAWVAPRPRGPIVFAALLVAGVLGCLWATVVNFAQLWFPTRTVSLNNLAAEFAGVMAGALLWSVLGATGWQWWQQLVSGGRISMKAALSGYVVVYLVASLTPFDFVVSGDQIAEKAASGLYGLWIAPVSCGPAPCGLKFLAAMLAAIPCGWWLAARRRRASAAWFPGVLIALIFAAIIELLHFLMVSGVSQGASVFVRTLGMALGMATYAWRRRLAALDLDRVGRPAVLALLVPYLLALAYIGGWFRSPPLDPAAGLARLNNVVWLPFFYQYYSPYQSTMSSAIVHAALYAAVGVACWLWARRRDHVSLWCATLLAVLLAFVVEMSKLFLAGHLPDFTDAFIAAVSATLVLAVLRFTSKSHQLPVGSPSGCYPDAGQQPRDAGTPEAPAVNPATATVGMRIAGGLLLLVAAVTIIGFPMAPWTLALGLAVYAGVLLRYPTATYLIGIPLLLPVLDLAPFSGRFFWDEFDLLLATTLGVRLLTTLPVRQPAAPIPRAALWLLSVSLVVSTAIGLWPPAPFDPNAFSNYLSTYNALRVAKGYVWAGALLWLIRRDASARRNVVLPLQFGLGLGLVAATISVYWERLVFLGSFDLGNVFRAAGFVSATHVGGAYLEAVLVMLAPFALALALRANGLIQRLTWFVVVLLGAGAIVLTASRAALVAWIVSVAAFGLVWWLKRESPGAAAPGSRWPWGLGVAFVMGFAVAPLAAQSSFLQQRLAGSRSDFSVRVEHWNDAMDLMRPDPLHALFGMGLGSFPREYYLGHAWNQQLPAYILERDVLSRQYYLVLAGGRGMYMDQRVATMAGTELRLTGLIRSPGANATLAISLCEKSFLNSVGCNEVPVSATSTWQPFDVRLSSPQRAESRLTAAAPISLSLHSGTYGSRVDVTRLSLLDAQTELLSNGSFEHGLDHWFVTSDVHSAWRVLSTPLQIAFEQGALGILAWIVFCAVAVTAVLRPGGSPVVTAAVAAAGAGLFVAGCFDSLLDSPRVVILIALVMAVGTNERVVERIAASRSSD